MTDYEKKQQKIKELSALIGLVVDKPHTKEQRARVVELEDRLQFRIAELQNEFANREADTKIAIMEEVYKALNKK